jgi:TRAP-type C4-dicarboxylate transport system permease small subunit
MLAVCERLGRYLANAVAVVGLTVLMILAVLTLADGLMRSLLNYPLDGVRDAGSLAIAIGISCCFPIALMERSNITMRFITPLFGSRAGHFCDLLAALLTGLIFLGMAYKLTRYASDLAHTDDMTWILHIPTAPFWFVVAAVIWLSFLIQIVMIFVAVANLIDPARADIPTTEYDSPLGGPS